MGLTLTLRDLGSLEEVPELLDVWRGCVEAGRDFLSAADIDAVASALELVYTKRANVRVAHYGEEIVGFVVWGANRLEILWVHKSFRQHGVGRALAESIIGESTTLDIAINAQNRASLEFLLACGFVVTAEPDPTDDYARLELSHVEGRLQAVAP